jgi:hypothetical protein
MGSLRYGDKAERFKDLTYKENRGHPLKWKDPDALNAYLEGFGGRLKEDMRRRRGYLVCILQKRTITFPALVAEVPMDFAEKVLAMGGFP